MVDGFDNEIESDPVFQSAADWLIRLQQPSLSLEETTEWQRWMNADPRHARAFERIEELWGKCATVQWPARETPSTEATQDYDGSEPVTHWLARQTPATDGFRAEVSSRGRTRAAWVITGAVALSAAAVLQMFVIDTSRATSFETPIGSNTTVTLADGSVIELAAHSRCEVRLDRANRSVTLLRGEALFHVTKDAQRPFRVRAGNADVEAVGTEFDVRRTADRVVVSVVEGRVMVQHLEPVIPVSWLNWTYTNGEPVSVGAGNQASLNAAGVEPQQAMADAETTLSWRHGRLAFDREPLRDVIEDVNRYSTTPITLDDRRMGDILITGTVTASDIDGWLASLKAAFGLRAEHHSDRIVLKGPRPRHGS